MNKASMQDQHLDLLIRLAFEQINEEEISELIQSDDPPLSAEESIRMEQCYQKAVCLSERFRHQERHNARRKNVKKTFRAISVGFAAMLIVALIALPVAFAVSSEFRTSVMKLFVEIDETEHEAHFSFHADSAYSQEENGSGKAAEIPDGWKGEYYPYYIPEDMSVTYISQYDGTDVEFEGDGDRKIAFSEYDSGTSLVAGTEDAVITQITLSNGATAIVIEGDSREIHTFSVTWAIGDKWFDLTVFNLASEQAIRIAESVKRIIQ